MIRDEYHIRPRYGEVDRMGYVYHSNYVTYCHQARTELLRKLNIHDNRLEENNIVLPVISFTIDYKKPAHYDELLTSITRIPKMPQVRFDFEFEIRNSTNALICSAKSTVVFVNKKTRNPIQIPDFVKYKLESSMHTIKI